MTINSRFLLNLALLLLAAMCPGQVMAGSAYWTGRSEMVQTVTYRMAWRCEYNYNGRVFAQVFESSCPSSVNVETPAGNDYQTSSSGNSSYSAKAYWSGESEMVQDVNYQMVWRCVYLYSGQRIAKLFRSSCPSSIDVR